MLRMREVRCYLENSQFQNIAAFLNIFRKISKNKLNDSNSWKHKLELLSQTHPNISEY